MPETPFTGLTASVKLGAVVLGYISGFDLDLEKEIIEILAFGMQYKEKIPAIKDWSASIDGTFAMTTGGSQKTLYDAFEDGTSLEFGVFLDETTYFVGSGYVSNLKISSAPDDKTTLSADVEGSGALLLTLPVV